MRFVFSCAVVVDVFSCAAVVGVLILCVAVFLVVRRHLVGYKFAK